MRHLIFALALCGAVTASAVTATKEYVDRKDSALATSATNLVASATNEISKAVTKAQSTADAAKASAAKNADALAKHTGDTANPHKVTAAQVGALTDSAAEAKYAQKADVVMKSDTSLVMSKANEVTIGEGAVGHSLAVAIGLKATAANWNGVAIGTSAYAMDNSVALGIYSYAPYASFGVRYLPSNFYFNSSSTDDGATKKSLQEYLDERATTNALAEVKASIPVISATDATFSNAVLAVGLNIDTNSVAVLNALAKDFGGFPLSAGETATTVGGLLAALAAGLAALKKSVSTLSAKVDDANAALEEVA